MSRIKDLEQLGRRDLLVICWKYAPQFFALLAPAAQWELHRFYGPSLELADEQTLERIHAARRLEPSLPSKAGKHYKIIFDRYKSYADVVGKANVVPIRELLRRDLIQPSGPIDIEGDRYRSGRVRSYAVMQPEPDVEKLARAFKTLAEYMRKTNDEN